MKKRRFSDIEEDIIRMSVARNIMPSEIAAQLTASGYPRSTGTIIRKIWSMNLVYAERVKLRLERRADAKKQKNQYHHKQVSVQERGQLLSYHPNHTEKWQNAITLSKAKIVDLKGTKIYMIEGRPVTFREIMRYLPE